MHQLAMMPGVVRWVRDDRISRAVIVERKRVLTVVDVAAIDAAQAKGFQVPDQRAITRARLGKGSDAPAAKVRNQRHHCCPWRRIEISFAALEVASLAHQPANKVSDFSYFANCERDYYFLHAVR